MNLKSKFSQSILFIVIFLFLFYFVYYKEWKEREASLEEAIYVRVKIDNINTSTRGGPYFYYKYEINDSLFEGSESIGNNSMASESKEKIKSYLGKYFYLKVSRNKPKYNELLIEYKVMDTTLIQPKSGWKELPEKIKSRYINENNDFFSGT